MTPDPDPVPVRETLRLTAAALDALLVAAHCRCPEAAAADGGLPCGVCVGRQAVDRARRALGEDRPGIGYDPLVALLYELARDHLPVGVLNGLVLNSRLRLGSTGFILSDVKLAELAAQAAASLYSPLPPTGTREQWERTTAKITADIQPVRPADWIDLRLTVAGRGDFPGGGEAIAAKTAADVVAAGAFEVAATAYRDDGVSYDVEAERAKAERQAPTTMREALAQAEATIAASAAARQAVAAVVREVVAPSPPLPPAPRPAGDAAADLEALYGLIRAVRDQRGDDRCWRDWERVYAALPEGYTPPARDAEVELDNCRRYIKACRDPNVAYHSPQREIERLERLRASSAATLTACVAAVLARLPVGVVTRAAAAAREAPPPAGPDAAGVGRLAETVAWALLGGA